MQREKTTTTTTTRTKTNGKSTVTKPVASVGPSRTSNIVVAPEERHRMIQEAAYLRAERRNFQNGDPRQDWLEAEVEVDDRIASWQRKGTRTRAD